jgi:two-component system, NtrC family, sensor histidine kinase HydH
MNPWPTASVPAEEDFLPGRVLIVEDDPVQAKLLIRSIVELGEGWQAQAVSSANAALEALNTTTFSLALVDLVLPDTSGLDLIRRIRAKGYVLALILVTAHGTEETAVTALRLGASDYIQKREGYLADVPFIVSRIVAEHRRNLRKLSEHSRLRMELAQKTHRGLLDSFAAPIVHDIKNPLSVIRASTDMLAAGGRYDPASVVPLIQRGVDRIQELLDQLLQFARQEQEERVSLDLGTLLIDLTYAESDVLRLQNIRLVRQLPADPVPVRAAKRALAQVIQNLVANASEALAKSHGGGIIKVSLTTEGECALITVEDSGPGIPSEIFPRLFTPFTTFGKPTGTGLGLSISAGVVREHGGDIEAENVPGSGARFRIRLPLEHRGPRALVLEDEDHMQELVKTQLEMLGVRAELEADGDGVIRRLDDAWDLVILDIRTPRVSGLDAFRAIIARRPELVSRTMLLSGSIADRDVQEMLAQHPVPVLPKPYGMAEFNDVVRLVLRGRKEARPNA